MVEATFGQLRFEIEPDLLHPERFRWVVIESDSIVLRSPQTYPTREKAVVEAAWALRKIGARPTGVPPGR